MTKKEKERELTKIEKISDECISEGFSLRQLSHLGQLLSAIAEKNINA